MHLGALFVGIQRFQYQNGEQDEKDKYDRQEKGERKTEKRGDLENKPGAEKEQPPGESEQKTQKRVEQRALHSLPVPSELVGIALVEHYRAAEVNISQHHENERLKQRHERQQCKRDHRQQPRGKHQDDHQEHVVALDITEKTE